MSVFEATGFNLKVQLVKMWDLHVRGLGWHTLEKKKFLFFSCLFIYFLANHTIDEHRHKILVVLILIMENLLFKKNIIHFKFQIWKKKIRNYIKTSTTKVLNFWQIQASFLFVIRCNISPCAQFLLAFSLFLIFLFHRNHDHLLLCCSFSRKGNQFRIFFINLNFFQLLKMGVPTRYDQNFLSSFI